MRRIVAAALLAVACAMVATAAGSTAAGPRVTVALGYASGTGGLKPWSGSPKTTFLGAAPTCCITHGAGNGQHGYDAGAIEITNDGSAPVTVGAVTVDLKGGTPSAFALWWRGEPKLPQVVAPGAHLVLTMRNRFDFDTSEAGGEACGPNNHLVADVHVTVDGKTTTYRDDRQILTTSGTDLNSCPGASEAWPFTRVVPGHQPSAKPTPRATPHVVGTPAVAHVLSALPGAFSGSPVPTESFQWLRCSGSRCLAIPRATTLTYVPVAVDTGRRLRFRVTAKNSAGSRALVSAPTPAIAASPATLQLGNTSTGTDAELASDQSEFVATFTAPKSGTSQAFEFYAFGGANDQTFTPSIYSVVDGKPSVQLGKGAPVVVAKGAEPRWFTSSLEGTTLTAGQTYALVLDGTGAFNGTFLSKTRGGQMSFFLDYTPS